MPDASESVTDKRSETPKAVCSALDIAFSIDSGVGATRIALEQVFEALQPLELDFEETSTIELVLAEVLNNIVEHSYKEHSGPIHIRCAHHMDGLHVAIRDQGCIMPEGQAPIGALQSYDVDTQDLPEGGFGWFLIQDLAKDVLYQRVGDENQLQLRIAVGYALSH